MIICDSQGRQEVLTDLLSSNQIKVTNSIDWIDFLEQDEKLCITNASLSEGMICNEIAIITENNLFGSDIVKQKGVDELSIKTSMRP